MKSGDSKTYYGIDKLKPGDRMRQKYPDLPDTVTPLPYYASLRRVLRSHGAAVLCVYFEIFHSIDRDTNVVLAHVQRELQITKRAWWWIASAIANRHANETHRRIAQKAHREFVRDAKGISGLVTPYSLTGIDAGPTTCILRRNQTALDQLLAKAGLTASQIRDDAAKLTPRPRAESDVKSTDGAQAPTFSPSAVSSAEKLSDEIEARLANCIHRGGLRG